MKKLENKKQIEKITVSIKVLLIEDDPDNAFLISELLTGEKSSIKYKIAVAGNLKQAFVILKKQEIDIVLLDLGLPDSSGIDTLERTHQAFPQVPIVVVTGLSDPEKEAEMLRIGAQDYLVKNKLSAENIEKAIQHALERFKFLQSIRSERDSLADFVEVLCKGKSDSQLCQNSRTNAEDIMDEKIIQEKARQLSELMAEREQLLMSIKDKNNQLEELATHDSLTNLPNRLQFETVMARDLAQAIRHHRLLCLLFLDLDGFKDVNDSLGHNIGDLLLVEVARRFCAALRKEDFIARLGGDEFAVILSNVKAIHSAGAVANKLIAVVNQPFQLLGHEVFVGVSIGIATYPDSGNDWRTLVKDADIAMYQAKQEGRNTFRYMAASMGTTQDREFELENKLQSALKRNEFFLVYQPLWELQSKKMFGMEVLLRWKQQPEVLPSIFVPIAEKLGLINDIGEWVLKTSCKQYQQWFGNERGKNNYLLSVNLSARQLEQKKIAHIVSAILQHENICSYNITLELTETAIMQHEAQASEILGQLHKIGVKIAIDDFGTGYSSLSRLSHLPIHMLKIDKSFVENIGIDKNDEIIIKTTIALAQSLGLQILAEGVETEEQRQFLIKNGCIYAQGYYFSKPLTVEEMAKFIAQQK